MVKFVSVVMLWFACCNVYSQESDCYRELEPIEFKLSMDSCVNEILFDTRPMENFKNKTIENSIHVPGINDLEKITDTLDLDTPIFVYCVIGMRSTKVSKLLCEKEFTNVINLKGGIENWKKQDLNVVKIKK